MSCNGKPCGCGGQGITTPQNTSGDCQQESCSELFCEECIVHCQPEISVTLGNNTKFVISQGERLDEVIQKLMLAVVDPLSVPTAPVGLKFVSRTQTSLSIKWKKVAGSTYSVIYTDGVTPVTVNAGAVGEYTIINLTSATEYTISIQNNETGYYSVLLKVKTT